MGLRKAAATWAHPHSMTRPGHKLKCAPYDTVDGKKSDGEPLTHAASREKPRGADPELSLDLGGH